LKRLDLSPTFILTHSVDGEYGHPHHKTVSAAARMHYNSTPIITFAHFSRTPSFTIEVPDYYDQCVACYLSQADTIRRFHREFLCCRIGRYHHG